MLGLVLAIFLVLAAPAGAREAIDPAVAPEAVFPIEGNVDYGNARNRFMGRPGHQGHDVFADCGTPVLAAAGGRVLEAEFSGAAGNYAVIRTAEGRSHVYMHLRAPARARAGASVTAGERLGSVGQSGNAWDCHLHFEIWTAPGWYRGGRPIDPLPFLRTLR